MLLLHMPQWHWICCLDSIRALKILRKMPKQLKARISKAGHPQVSAGSFLRGSKSMAGCGTIERKCRPATVLPNPAEMY